MKIGSTVNQAQLSTLHNDRKGGTERSGSAQAGTASATVQLSATATSLMDNSGGDGSFDAAKVERIAQAIRDGKFQVNHEAIADKLIANATEMLGRTQQAH